MNTRGRELLLFAIRWLVLLGAGLSLLVPVSHVIRGGTLHGLPTPGWILAGLAIYGIAAFSILYARHDRTFTTLFLVLDIAWIFVVCLLAGSQRDTYAWLFLIPLVTSATGKDHAKLSFTLFLCLLGLSEVQFAVPPAVRSGRAAAGDPFFFLQILVFFCVTAALMLSGQPDKAPVAKLTGGDEKADEYNRKLRRLAGDKEEATRLLYDKIRQHAVLYEIIGHITHTLDTEKILELTVKRCKEELRSEISFMMLVDGNDVIVRAGNGLSKPAAEAFRSRIGEKPFGNLILTGETLCENPQQETHPVLDSLAHLKPVQRIRDILVVPLKSPTPGLPTRGLLGLANSLSDTGFTRDHLEMLTILAGQVAVALDNAQLASRQKAFFKETIEALAAAINQKHKYTHVLHSKSVAKWAVDIARELRLSQEETERIEIAAILHDAGKIAIPDEILTKPGLLSPEEMKVMQEHPSKGGEILKGISMIQEMIPLIRGHHERWDGTGYPDRLAGERIPLGAQIIAVADTFDAMTANRPYHKGMDRAEAVRTIKEDAGKQFNPRVVEAFLAVMAAREPIDASSRMAPATQNAAPGRPAAQ